MCRMTLPQLLCCSSLILLTMFLHIGAQLTPPGPTCPGRVAVFSCVIFDASGTGGGATFWRVNDSLSSQCEVKHDNTSGTPTCDSNGEFTAALVAGNSSHFTSTLTVVVTDMLNGTTVQCRSAGSDIFPATLEVIGVPSFMPSDSVTQDITANSPDVSTGSTVIKWDPASVNYGGVTYMYNANFSVSLLSNNTMDTNTSLKQLLYNSRYDVFVDAMNVCNQPTGSPLSGTVILQAKVIQPYIGGLSLTCSDVEDNLRATITWTLNDSSTDECLRPPLTKLMLKCNSLDTIPQLVQPSPSIITMKENEACFRSVLKVGNQENSTFLIDVKNAIGEESDSEDFSVYRLKFPQNGVLIRQGTVSFELNRLCSEEASSFTLSVSYGQPEMEVTMATVDHTDNIFDVTYVGIQSNTTYEISIILSHDVTGVVQRYDNITTISGGTSLAIFIAPPIAFVVLLLAVFIVVNILLHGVLVYGSLKYLYLLHCAGCCYPENERQMMMPKVSAIFVFIFYATPVTTAILSYYLCCKSSGGWRVPKEGDDVHLKEGTLSHEQELPTYQDPGEIKRQPAPDSHDVYTVPEKKPKKKKAQAARVEEISAAEAGPMYQDPDTINRQPAPESGELYTVVEPTKKASSRRKPPVAPAKTDAELAEMYSTPDKSRQREGVNYTDLSLPGSSAPPPSQGGVQYSQVRM